MFKEKQIKSSNSTHTLAQFFGFAQQLIKAHTQTLQLLFSFKKQTLPLAYMELHKLNQYFFCVSVYVVWLSCDKKPQLVSLFTLKNRATM